MVTTLGGVGSAVVIYFMKSLLQFESRYGVLREGRSASLHVYVCWNRLRTFVKSLVTIQCSVLLYTVGDPKRV